MAPGIEKGAGPASGTGPGPNGHETAPAAAASTTAQHPHPHPSGTSTSTSPASARHQSQAHSSASSPYKRRMSQSYEPAAAAAAAAAAQLDGGRDAAAKPKASPRPVAHTESAAAAAAAAAAEPSSASAAKRARPEAAPPKMLPEQYEFCPVEDMVVLIANMLGELIETNDALKSGHLTRFHSRTAPGISVLDYLHRLAKHATLTPPLLLSMVYYIDRLCAMYPDFTINTLTVHRFLITAAAVAAKGLSDSFWNNSTYARIGGVRVNELKMLELEFLYRLDWKIVPNPEVLAAYYRPLVERCPGYALPPDHSAVANSPTSPPSDDSDGDGDDEGGDSPDNGRTPQISHHRQSSTSLIGEDMVIAGLARPTRPDRG